MDIEEICKKAGLTVYPAEHNDSAVVITISSLEHVISVAIKQTDLYREAEKQIIEKMYEAMRELAPTMRKTNLQYALDLVPFFAEALMHRGLQAEKENRKLRQQLGEKL